MKPSCYPHGILARDLIELIAHLGARPISTSAAFRSARGPSSRRSARGCGRARRSSPGWGCAGSQNWDQRADLLRRGDRRFRHRAARRPALAGDPVHEDDEDRPRRRRATCSPASTTRATTGSPPSPCRRWSCAARGRGQWLGARACRGAARCDLRRSPRHPHELGHQAGTRRGNRPLPRRMMATLLASYAQPSGSKLHATTDSYGRGRLAMKFAASVSLAALALAGCATTPGAVAAADAPVAGEPPAASAGAALTARRRARIHRRGRKGSVRPHVDRAAAPAGSTPPTSTTTPTRSPPISAPSAPRRASNTRKRRRKYAARPGARLRHRAQARHPARRAGAGGADDARRRGRAQHIATRLQSTYGKGRATLNGKADHRRRRRGS